jgi:hypothetical protein
MIRIILIAVLAFSLTACGGLRSDKSRKAESENELPFRAKLSKGEDKRDVTITVANEGAGLDEVRESVRFEATKYCLLNYGASDADWQIDEATGDWAFTQSDSALIFNARCSAR